MQAAPLSLTIRPVELERDAARIITYARDLFAISFGGTRFAEQFGDDGAAYIPWVAEKQALARGNAGLALLEGEPAGMVLLGPWPDDAAIGYVHHYYLEPHARGRGLGSGLDAYAVSVLRRSGHRSARLSVAQTNTRAIRAYLKQGWAHAGPRADQPGILCMHRSLNVPLAALPISKGILDEPPASNRKAWDAPGRGEVSEDFPELDLDRAADRIPIG